jgi:hypothetical protein
VDGLLVEVLVLFMLAEHLAQQPEVEELSHIQARVEMEPMLLVVGEHLALEVVLVVPVS